MIKSCFHLIKQQFSKKKIVFLSLYVFFLTQQKAVPVYHLPHTLYTGFIFMGVQTEIHILTYGHTDIRIRKYGHSDIQIYRHTDIHIRTYGPTYCTYSLTDIHILSYGHTDIQTYTHTDIQTYSHTEI